MALIKCPGCGKEINDDAVRCPACGFELHPESNHDAERQAMLSSLASSLDSVKNKTQSEQLKELQTYLLSERKEIEVNKSSSVGPLCVVLFILFGLFIAIGKAGSGNQGGSGKRIIFILLLFIFIAISAYGLYLWGKFSEGDDKIKAIDKHLEDITKQITVSRQDAVKAKYSMLLSELGYNEKHIELATKTIWFTTSDFVIASSFSYFENKARQYIKTGEGPLPETISYQKIRIQDIQYYSKEGDVQYTTEVSGGGGGGSSLGGAIIGGMIAGDAGAVIGSRKAIESVKSTTVAHDERKTVLRYYENGAIKTFVLPGFEAYEFFLQNIPEKDLQTMQLNSKAHSTKVSLPPAAVPAKPFDINTRLEELANLYKAGLIDDAEYKQMKTKVLEQYT